MVTPLPVGPGSVRATLQFVVKSWAYLGVLLLVGGCALGQGVDPPSVGSPDGGLGPLPGAGGTAVGTGGAAPGGQASSGGTGGLEPTWLGGAAGMGHARATGGSP